MLFQLQLVEEYEDGYQMYMCRRKDILTDEEKDEIKEKHKDDPDPEQATQDEIDEYNEEKYDTGGEYDVTIPPYNEQITEDKVPEEYMDEYKEMRRKIEETDKVKVNGQKTGKFFKAQKSPFGCAYAEDVRPRDCYLYKVTAYKFMETQEKPEDLTVRMYSSRVRIEKEYTENSELDYPDFIMSYIKELVPIEEGRPVTESPVDFSKVCRTEDFNEDFMREYQDYLDWEMTSMYQILSESFLLEFKDKVNWNIVSKTQTLSEDFIKDNIDLVNVPIIIDNQDSITTRTVQEFITAGVTSWESIFDTLSPKLSTVDKFKDIIDWKLVCESCKLTEEFIDAHLDYIAPYWDSVTKFQEHLSEGFLKEHEKDINWAIASETQTLSKELIDDHYTELDWRVICKNQSLDEDTIDKYSSRLNWHNLLTNIKFTEDRLDKYFNNLKGEWRTVSIFQKISIKWLEKHINDIDKEDWNMLASNMEFDIDFIRKYKSRVDWTIISGPKYILTEAFIDEFKDYVDWQSICGFQNISNNFIMDHYQYIDWDAISKNKEILTEEFIDRHKKKLSWDIVEAVFQMSEEFINDHIDYVTWYNLFRFQNLSKDFIEKYRWKLTEKERQELGI